MLKKEIKENKYTIFVFVIFVIIFLVGWLVFGLVMPKSGTPIYGDRLEKIKGIEFTSEQSEKLIKVLKEKSYITDAKVDIKGGIINVIITVKSETEKSTAKGAGDIILESLTDEQKKGYDIQLFVKNEKDDVSGYPFIGYKNSSDKSFTY